MMIAVAVALAATLLHVVLVRPDRRAFVCALGAFAGLAPIQVVYWTFTYPMTLASCYWTVPPEPFEAARLQWEYSHAASAVLTFGSLVALVISVLVYETSTATAATSST